MIRKVPIVVLTLATVSSGVLLVVSHRRPVVWGREHFIECPDCGGTSVSYSWTLTGGVLEAQFIERLPQGKVFPPTYDFRILRVPDTETSFRSVMHQRIQFVVNAVYLPLWMPLILFATYPTIAFVRGPVRRHRRRRKGLCIVCGYSLIGNVSGVCPECGTQLDFQ